MIRYRKSWSGILFDVFNHSFLVLLCITMLYPFYYALVASISEPSLVLRSRGLLFWPKGINFGAYRQVLQNPIIGKAYLNTIFYVTAGTSINIVLTAFGAYALSRKHLWGREFIMMVIVFTMFFSGGLIPQFLLVKRLGMIDTRWALLLPTAINTYNLIIMRTGFSSIPDSLEESAKIDGANDFTILFRIYIPIALPTLAVMILFYAVGHWNAWFWAMVYLRNRALYPLQLILREILISADVSSMLTDIAMVDQIPLSFIIKYAAIIITMAPITILYPFLQKYFIKGIMIGSLKG